MALIWLLLVLCSVASKFGQISGRGIARLTRLPRCDSVRWAKYADQDTGKNDSDWGDPCYIRARCHSTTADMTHRPYDWESYHVIIWSRRSIFSVHYVNFFMQTYNPCVNIKYNLQLYTQKESWCSTRASQSPCKLRLTRNEQVYITECGTSRK